MDRIKSGVRIPTCDDVLKVTAEQNPAPITECPDCSTHFPPSTLNCPVCHRLIYKDTLKELVAAAEAASNQGRHSEALGQWRTALGLLPGQSRQYEVVSKKIDHLSKLVDSSPESLSEPPPKKSTGLAAKGGIVAAFAMMVWKFKAIIAFALTKGKFLLLGLSKSSTVFSMFLTVGLYATIWGWKFALGIVVSIYIHEIGHVAALSRLGIAATAPMFIPGIGAIVRLKQYPHTPREDARVGLAGPMWGLGAAVAAYLIFLVTGNALFAAIAKIGAWINLFNLLPLYPLDGGRGFKAMTRTQKWIATASVGGAFLVTQEGMLLLLGVMAVVQTVKKEQPLESDKTALGQYVFLIITLSIINMLELPNIG